MNFPSLVHTLSRGRNHWIPIPYNKSCKVLMDGNWGRYFQITINWWWGEGDEKFYVDGEKYPSTFGTGSEDYIGFTWSAEAPFPMFQSPFASQPHVPIDSNGHTSINRFHIADNVPFRTSFTAVIERFKTQVTECETDYVAYFYLRPGQRDRYEPLPDEELKLQKVPAPVATP